MSVWRWHECGKNSKNTKYNMNKNFTQEFYRMWEKITTIEPIAYARYADGEVALMQGRKVDENSQASRIDRWNSLENGITDIGKDLKETLYHTESNYYYAISCKCCDPNGQSWLLNEIKQPEENITFSNLWINANYKLFIEQIGKLTEPVYLICNKRGESGMYPFDACGFYPINDNCVEEWKSNKHKIIEDVTSISKTSTNTLFLISAGPLSELLIHHMWNTNKNNRYIDVGSSIDEFVHNKQTRPFMNPLSPYFNMNCVF